MFVSTATSISRDGRPEHFETGDPAILQLCVSPGHLPRRWLCQQGRPLSRAGDRPRRPIPRHRRRVHRCDLARGRSPGKKHHRRIELVGWQQNIVAQLPSISCAGSSIPTARAQSTDSRFSCAMGSESTPTRGISSRISRRTSADCSAPLATLSASDGSNQATGTSPWPTDIASRYSTHSLVRSLDAGGGIRTPTLSRAPAPKTGASTSSATPAQAPIVEAEPGNLTLNARPTPLRRF